MFVAIVRGVLVVGVVAVSGLVAPPHASPGVSVSPSYAMAASEPGRYGSLSEVEDVPEAAFADSPIITAGECKYQQSVDNPHTSSGQASVHGYWLQRSSMCPSKANVDTALQAVWCDQYGCRWKTVVEVSGDVAAGGGAGKRVTARRTCSSSRQIGWRGRVDVDPLGVADPTGYTYSSGVDLFCHP